MRGSLPTFLARRFVALAITVVAAPTFAYTVFNALGGNLGGESIPVFAWRYAVTTFWHHDLGYTLTYQEPVAHTIAWTLPADLALLLGGIGVGIGLGLAAGVLCAGRPGSVVARGVHAVTALVLSTPPYWLGFMVLLFFAPGTGYVLRLPFVSALSEYVGVTQDPLRWLESLWLPWVVIGLPLAANVARMTESSLREVMHEHSIRTAHAKGVPRRRVLRRHALPLALAPVAALAGTTMPLLITNVALMESAFNIPGLYREVRSIGSAADYQLLQGMIVETTVVIVVANMLADAVQARLDPTVR